MSSSGDRDPALINIASVLSALGNPAAGADWSNAPGAGKACLSIVATLTTSATVANRVPQLVIKSGANIIAASPPAPAQAAGAAVQYEWSQVAFLSGATGALVMMPMPLIPLGAGWTIGTSTAALQAGDQWSAINLILAG